MKKFFIFFMSLMLAPGVALLVGCASGGGGGGGDSGGDTYDPNAIIITENIDTATTWTGDKVYVVDGYIYVNAALTIEGGTIIKFTANGGMAVNTGGTINASGGTALTPIVFTSIKDDTRGGDTNMDGSASTPLAANWYDILVQENGSVFNYCEFYYGGGYWGDTLEIDAVGTVTNCTFAHNKGGAPYNNGVLNASSADAGTVITGNRFYDNVKPIVINTTFNLNSSNIFQDITGTIKNTMNGIFVAGTDIIGNISWSETEVPYVLESEFTVDSGSVLTIAQNAVIKFTADIGATIIGTLNANGSSGNPIVFTSIKDDTHGGDTNADGAATTPLAADWYDISVQANGTVLNYCEFYYGGGYWGDTLEIFDSVGTVTNCTFAHNLGGVPYDYGVLNAYGALAGTVITGNRFYDNEKPMRINTNFNLDSSNIFEDITGTIKNTRNGIFVAGDTISGARSWSETEVAYVIENYLDVADTGSLTLANTVVLKFLSGIEMDYSGTNLINYNGTGVAFTSIKDDSRKGDTNGDATATSAANGDWEGIYSRSLSDYIIAWTNIFYDSYAQN
ncbi:MAG: hypothetical protein JXQ30_06300 [Spirochaetes bacterium]|nr:hypothetical protein [Spirochaetota bacterium]